MDACQMHIASWNVNSIKARLPVAQKWVEECQADIICLQELKCVDAAFPSEIFEELGYNVETHGQKTYNGVAILSKYPFEDVSKGLPGDASDEQARYLEATFSVDGQPLKVASIYLPNGNPVDSEKYPYKLAWMDRLIDHVDNLLKDEIPLVLSGDYNLIPTEKDVYSPKSFEGDALFRPESHERFRKLLGLGLTEAFTAARNEDHAYTYWDYMRGAWQKDNGIRIDHHLLSPQAADLLLDCTIDRVPRGWEKPSDHTPILVELSL